MGGRQSRLPDASEQQGNVIGEGKGVSVAISDNLVNNLQQQQEQGKPTARSDLICCVVTGAAIS